MAEPAEEFWEEEAELLRDLLEHHILEAELAATKAAIAALPETARPSIDWDLINQRARTQAAQYTYELVTEINQTSKSFLRKALDEWITSGQPLDRLVDSLADSGIWGPVRAEMIAVTEVTRAYAEGNRLAWKESGVVSGMAWQTARDDLVCDVCGPLHGQVDILDGDFAGNGPPPAHVRCRCWLKPVVNG